MSLLRSAALITALGLAYAPLLAQQTTLRDYEEPEAYLVYSAILSVPENSNRPVPKAYLIRGETLRTFGAFIDNAESPGGTCLKAEPASEQRVAPAIEDFVKANGVKHRLLPRFEIATPYRLVGSESLLSLIRQDGWTSFYNKYPGVDGFIDLSAVGFNSDKTVAVVAKGRWCGDLCGEGSYYVLEKRNGRWGPMEWKGRSCSWIS